MDDSIIGAARSILELGWPAIVLIQSVILYRELNKMTDRYIAHLEGQQKAQETARHTPPEDFSI